MSPRLPPSTCLTPGCRRQATPGRRRCRECGQKRAAEKGKLDPRASAQDRGYDARWQKVRARKAKKDPLCEDCLEEGRVVPLDMVDHVIPLRAGGARLDLRNLRSLCWPCHGKKSAKDRERYPELY